MSIFDQPLPSQPSHLVPIRSIGPAQRDRIAEHLLNLQAHDRYLRFGYRAADEQIRRYVAGLNFEQDEIYGIYNRQLKLLSVAHLAFSNATHDLGCAEFGVSVLTHARNRGYGARMFDRAIMHARNEGVTMMFIHALSENTAMLKIAERAGARVERDGIESDAYLTLPQATLDSRVTEMLQRQIGETDYQLKVQAKAFRSWLSDMRLGRTASQHEPSDPPK